MFTAALIVLAGLALLLKLGVAADVLELRRTRGPLERLSDSYNVLDFGAIGDGVNDDTVAFRSAVAAAQVGSTLYIPRGNYLLTTCALTKRLRIAGDGDSSILIASGTTAKVLTVEASAGGSIIQDIAIYGTKTDETDGAQYGIQVKTGADDTRIEHVTFSGSTGLTGLNIHVHMQAVNRCRVEKCRLDQIKGTSSGFGYGILVQTCLDCTVADNVSIQAAANGRHHVYMSAGTKRCLVAGNRFSGGTQEMITVYALEVQDWCENNIIDGNVLTDNFSAVALSGAIGLTQKCRNNLIRGNIIRSYAQAGILIQGGTGVADSRAPFNKIIGNLVLDCGSVGIWLAGCDDCTVEANTVRGNGTLSVGSYVGISVASTGANTPTMRNMVLGNNCVDTVSQGGPIRVQTAAGVRPSGTVIRGNHAPKGNTRYMQDDGDLTMIDEVYTVKKVVGYADFAAAALTNFANLFTLGPGEKVESVIIKHETAFAGGAIGSYTVSVGIVGNYTKYAPAFNVFQAPGATVFQNADTVGLENMQTGETTVRALATSTVANLNAATAGMVQIFVRVRRHAMPVL